jgi:hypothetical protein
MKGLSNEELENPQKMMILIHLKSLPLLKFAKGKKISLQKWLPLWNLKEMTN